MAQAKDQAVVPQALPSLQVFPLPRALVSLAQTVQASHRPELLSRPEAVAQVCLWGQAKPAASLRLQLDSRRCRVMRCPLGARPHELAVARSWDFQF